MAKEDGGMTAGSKESVIADVATTAAVWTLPAWIQVFSGWLQLAAIIGTVVLLGLRILVTIREYRQTRHHSHLVHKVVNEVTHNDEP